MDRIATLTEILAANPADKLARYGLAMEYSNAGLVDEALEQFKKLIENNPDYAAAYFMAAQTRAPTKPRESWSMGSPRRAAQEISMRSRR